MRHALPTALLCAASIGAACADEPAAPAQAQGCLAANNRILGPRSANRPLPLLSGDAAHGFHAACAAPWSTLSPKNESLPVGDCFQGTLLRLDHVSACGLPPGPLWISSRWVVTSAELTATNKKAACQQLETGAWAATRDLDLKCLPQEKPAAKPAAAQPAAPATPPTSPPAH